MISNKGDTGAQFWRIDKSLCRPERGFLILCIQRSLTWTFPSLSGSDVLYVIESLSLSSADVHQALNLSLSVYVCLFGRGRLFSSKLSHTERYFEVFASNNLSSQQLKLPPLPTQFHLSSFFTYSSSMSTRLLATDILYWRFWENGGQLLIVEEDSFRVNVVEITVMEFHWPLLSFMGAPLISLHVSTIFPQDVPYKSPNS